MAKAKDEHVGTTFEEANAPREPLVESETHERFTVVPEAQAPEGALPEGCWQRSLTDPSIIVSLTDDRRFQLTVGEDGAESWVAVEAR